MKCLSTAGKLSFHEGALLVAHCSAVQMLQTTLGQNLVDSPQLRDSLTNLVSSELWWFWMLVCTIQIRVKSYKSIFVFSSIPVSMALLVSYSEVGGREGRKKKRFFWIFQYWKFWWQHVLGVTRVICESMSYIPVQIKLLRNGHTLL